MKPRVRPQNPCFASGPCSKRPGWTAAALARACLGRSHRSKDGIARIGELIERSRSVLGIPEDYRVGIVPGSDTGAIELALWSLLGPRGVDLLVWDSFGLAWAIDVMKQLKLSRHRMLQADYGKLPDLDECDPESDIVFTWNATTSGVRVPNGDWIGSGRGGLTICDATSAAFAMDLPWHKLDAVTYSWQKALGGEAGHGMLILSPRAVARIESHTPAWPMPKIFRLKSKGKFNEAVFRGETINTPSMLCIEDAIDGLKWAESIGGLHALIARAEANLAVCTRWVERTPWIGFLAAVPATRSCTSVCLRFTEDWFFRLDRRSQGEAVRRFADLLEAEHVAYDIASHPDAPPGLRLWAGATVERGDIEALLPWLEWAYGETRRALT